MNSKLKSPPTYEKTVSIFPIVLEIAKFLVDLKISNPIYFVVERATAFVAYC